MKKYIKPNSEVIDTRLQTHLLQASPDTFNDEVGDDGVWLAPKNEIGNGSFWGE